MTWLCRRLQSRALDRCAAGSSAWTRHTVQEHVTRITTEAGVQATPAELREFIALATELAVSDCFSILPPDAPTPEHVAHLTSLSVVAAETALRDQLTAARPKREPNHPDVTEAAQAAGLDDGQTVAAAAVASTDPLVIVEGAAGSGKTTMLAHRHRRSPPSRADRRGWLRRHCGRRKSRTKNSAYPPRALRRSCMRMGGGGTVTAYGHASHAGDTDPDDRAHLHRPAAEDAVLAAG